jgi:lauroyl/myristoyl acyltransferase
VKERLVATAYLVGWRVTRLLPERLVRLLCAAGAELVWRRRGTGVRRLEANLARVLGPAATGAELAAATRAGLRSYLRYWSEVFRLPSLGRDTVVRGTAMADGDILRDASASGRGAVAALPHMGNWDCAGAWAVYTGMPFTTVVERLQPESLFDRFAAFRESIGMEVVPLTGGPGNTYAELLRRLRAGALVCLLADRDLTTSGVEVDFFGAPARFPAGPAALALATGAPLLPVTLWYPGPGEPPGWRGRIHPAVPPPSEGSRRQKIAAMTQALADVFAEAIAAHPTDWHMLQRVWVTDPDPAAPAVARPPLPTR